MALLFRVLLKQQWHYVFSLCCTEKFSRRHSPHSSSFCPVCSSGNMCSTGVHKDWQLLVLTLLTVRSCRILYQQRPTTCDRWSWHCWWSPEQWACCLLPPGGTGGQPHRAGDQHWTDRGTDDTVGGWRWEWLWIPACNLPLLFKKFMLLYKLLSGNSLMYSVLDLFTHLCRYLKSSNWIQLINMLFEVVNDFIFIYTRLIHTRLILYSFIFHGKIGFFIIVGNDFIPGLNAMAIWPSIS